MQNYTIIISGISADHMTFSQSVPACYILLSVIILQLWEQQAYIHQPWISSPHITVIR